jgi:hypothetical protein
VFQEGEKVLHSFLAFKAIKCQLMFSAVCKLTGNLYVDLYVESNIIFFPPTDIKNKDKQKKRDTCGSELLKVSRPYSVYFSIKPGDALGP